MNIMKPGNNKRIRILAAVLLAAVIGAAACFFVILPDDIKPGRDNPQRVSDIRISRVTYDSVQMEWVAADNAEEYEIYRSLEKNGSYDSCGRVSETEYIDDKLDTGTEYWYMIRSFNGKKKSRYSERVKARPKLDRPMLKGFSTDEGAELDSDKITGATGYVFYRDGKVLRQQPSNICLDTDMKKDENHSYSVAAYRTVKGKKILSSESNSVTAGKLDIDMEFQGDKVPEKISTGESVDISGTILSNVEFTRVQIGITGADGRQWIDGQKYDKTGVDSRKFDISPASEELKFSQLQEGSYLFRVIAYPRGGNATIVTDQTFTVELNRAMAAVNWAIEIANDDSFSYGTGRQAHKRGCYFCGTNSRFKPSGYEKTYCCNPFVLAAFAHGVQNETVLKACQKGECGGMDPKDWTQYGCFETLGKTKEVSYDTLIPGDFIISKASAGGPYEHVWMICDGNRYVEAAGGGWGPGSIAVKDDAASYYRRYQTNGCYVMRYTGN